MNFKVTRGQIIARGPSNRCPNCGARSLFKEGTLFEVNPDCSHCGLKIERDEGGFAGWFSGFWIKSRDENFALRIGLQAAYRAQPYWQNGKSRDRSSLLLLRPYLAGNVFRPWIRFWTSLELAQDNPYLLDSYVEIQPVAAFGIRVGQHRPPISRHHTFSLQQILLADWSAVGTYFAPGRDKGITVLGTVLGQKLDYFAGVYSGSPPQQSASFPKSWATVARITASPMGPVPSAENAYVTAQARTPTRFSLTVQAAAANEVLAREASNPPLFGSEIEASDDRATYQLGGADFWLGGSRYLLFGEAYVRRQKTQDSSYVRAYGFWAQAGYMLVDRLIDVSTRYDWLNASQHLSKDVGYSIESQVGCYPFQDPMLSVKLRYAYAKQESPSDGELEGASLLFPAGKSHLVTAQLTLSI